MCPSLINLNESKIEYIYNTNIVNIIYKVIGESRIPCMKDVGSLPYTEAMIMELQRHSNIGLQI